LLHPQCPAPAISCPGAFRTPAVGARGWFRAGIQKPAQTLPFQNSEQNAGKPHEQTWPKYAAEVLEKY
jgi:hypothetical protein